jgi:hypothetical protein
MSPMDSAGVSHAGVPGALSRNGRESKVHPTTRSCQPKDMQVLDLESSILYMPVAIGL